jgi:2-aminobenzoate-CoA ligase
MKEIYPTREAIPGDYLVRPEWQPDFVWDAEIARLDKEVFNVASASVDIWCSKGFSNKVAVIDVVNNTNITYGDLKRMSDALAVSLVEIGANTGDRICLRYRNSYMAIVAVLGIWKAGCAVVPIPQQARRSEIEFYIQDTGAKYVIVDDDNADVIGELMEALPACSSVKDVIVGNRDPNSAGLNLEKLVKREQVHTEVLPKTSANDLATVWHTGGTTGRPKATYHTHRRWYAAGYTLGKAWNIGPDDRWIYAIPVGNVAGLLGRFICILQHGATLVELPRFKGEDLFAAIMDNNVTHVLAIPVTLDELDRVDTSHELENSRLQHVYAPFLVTGVGDLYERWAARGYQLANPLGSSIICNWFIGPIYGQVIPAFALGKPAPGYDVRIVSDEGNSVNELPAGEVGRIAVKGPTGLTYWNRPELQMKEVIDGWTITDDLGKKDKDGIIWFMGRLNNLVVTAGYKVVPGEVEEVLLKHQAVREVCVVGLPDPLREQVVTAFVVLNSGYNPSDSMAEELQAWCKKSLAPYKYPRRVCFLDHLPRDPVGKVQIRQLVQQVS